MSTLMKNLGIIILLIGVAILAIHAFVGSGGSNMYLLAGLGIIIVGFFAHIFLNKKFQ